MSLKNLYNTWRHSPHAPLLAKLFFDFYTQLKGVIQHSYIVPNNAILLVSLVLMYNKTHFITNVLYHWKSYYLINSSQVIRLLGTQGLLSQLYQILKR